jgi:hypothetical protein
MLSRTGTLFLLTIVLVSVVPLATYSERKQPSQDLPLVTSTKRGTRSDGRTVLNFSGRFAKWNKTIRLTGITVRDAHPRRKIKATGLGRSGPLVSQNRTIQRFSSASKIQNPAPIEGGDPGYDYYYTQGEMTSSDGTVLVDATYQYDSADNQNLLQIILHGVPLTFNLNTNQFEPVSDSDLAQLENWLLSGDGHLVQEAGIAIIQQGYQQTDNEALLIYYLISLLVDYDNSSEAILTLPDTRTSGALAHHATRYAQASSTRLTDISSIRPAASVAEFDLVKSVVPQGCYGCCGQAVTASQIDLGFPCTTAPANATTDAWRSMAGDVRRWAAPVGSWRLRLL